MPDQQEFLEQREFERFPLDFAVEISGISKFDDAFSDTGVMQNISGGGLCFTTSNPHWYGMGQRVDVHVCMPGTDELDAGMKCPAQVVWMHFGIQSDDSTDKSALIGLCLEGFMAFETERLRKQSGDTETPPSP